MTGTLPLAALQAAPELSGQLSWIAWAQTAMAAATVVLALLGIGVAVIAFSMLRSLGRVLATVERLMEQLGPRAEPLLASATRVSENAAEISDALREEVAQTRQTVAEVNEQVRALAQTAEARVRQFGAVVEVVQQEVEELLLDATAAARGLHATAEALRRGEAGPGALERRSEAQ